MTKRSNAFVARVELALILLKDHMRVGEENVVETEVLASEARLVLVMQRAFVTLEARLKLGK